MRAAAVKKGETWVQQYGIIGDLYTVGMRARARAKALRRGTQDNMPDFSSEVEREKREAEAKWLKDRPFLPARRRDMEVMRVRLLEDVRREIQNSLGGNGGGAGGAANGGGGGVMHSDFSGAEARLVSAMEAMVEQKLLPRILQQVDARMTLIGGLGGSSGGMSQSASSAALPGADSAGGARRGDAVGRRHMRNNRRTGGLSQANSLASLPTVTGVAGNGGAPSGATPLELPADDADMQI